MRFLLDVNAGGPVYEWLKKERHDVVRVRERDIRMSDEEILEWAIAEQRIIVTTDKDFEAIIWREGRPHKGVLRLENLPRKERMELLTETVKQYASDLKDSAIVIATQNKIRIRR